MSWLYCEAWCRPNDEWFYQLNAGRNTFWGHNYGIDKINVLAKPIQKFRASCRQRMNLFLPVFSWQNTNVAYFTPIRDIYSFWQHLSKLCMKLEWKTIQLYGLGQQLSLACSGRSAKKAVDSLQVNTFRIRFRLSQQLSSLRFGRPKVHRRKHRLFLNFKTYYFHEEFEYVG